MLGCICLYQLANWKYAPLSALSRRRLVQMVIVFNSSFCSIIAATSHLQFHHLNGFGSESNPATSTTTNAATGERRCSIKPEAANRLRAAVQCGNHKFLASASLIYYPGVCCISCARPCCLLAILPSGVTFASLKSASALAYLPVGR